MTTDGEPSLAEAAPGQLRKYAEDLTRIYRAEREKREKLAESERRYRALFDSAGDAIFIHDFSGRVLEMNAAARRRLGYGDDHAAGGPPDGAAGGDGAGGPAAIPPNLTMADVEGEAINATWMAGAIGVADMVAELSSLTEMAGMTGSAAGADLTGRLRRLETVDFLVVTSVNLTRDGIPVPVEMNCRRIEYYGRPAVLVIARDISERLRTEAESRRLSEQLQQAQKLESIGIMAAGIAHDLNNILFPILGYAEMAADEVPENSSVHDFLTQLIASARRGRDIVRGILTVARKSDGRREPVAVGPAIAEVLGLLRGTLPGNIRVREQVAPDAGAILTDPSQFHQILMNLCVNAFHAMDETGGALTVAAAPAVFTESDPDTPPAGPGRYVRLRVTDTGRGMPPEVLERIFEPYFTTKARGKGTGMGLATVYGIVKSHGGAIRAESVRDAGSAFTLFLPMAGETAPATAPDDPPPPARGNAEHLLVVDDEPAIVAMLTHMFRRMGYRVTGETDSHAALARFEAAPDDFHLSITDHVMPGLNGAELAKRIHHIRPDLPIIVCSGQEDGLTDAEAAAAGIREHLLKPPDRRLLAARVRQILDQDRKTILVIDDDPEIRNVLRLMLTRAGYEVVTARNGREGAHLREARGPDLIITDIMMPEKDGIDLIYEITAAFPDAKIIAISGGGFYGADLPLETARNLGAARTFAKPLAQDELLAAVREVLNGG